MKLFFCYPHSAIAEINRICSILPNDIRSLTDTKCLRIGEPWDNVVRSIISSEANYVVFYINNETANSKPMERELSWILQTEEEANRHILIPVVGDRKLLQSGYLSELSNRHILSFDAVDQSGIQKLKTDDDYRKVVTELLAHLSLLLIADRKLRSNVDNIETYLSTEENIARLIADIVQGTNRSHPRLFSEVVSALSRYDSNIGSASDVRNVIRKLGKLNILGGVFWTNDGIYEAYDDYKLKSLQNVDQKKRIAGVVVDKVNDGDIIILDSGTTCNELAKQLFQRISDHLLEDIDIIVCAASAVGPFLLYFEPRRLDKHASFRLHIPGGSVRVRNHAIITSDLIGRVDIADELERAMCTKKNIRKENIKAFIGANYFNEGGCFYSVEEDEAKNKARLIGASGEVFILVDSNKCTTEKQDNDRYGFFTSDNLRCDGMPKIYVVTDGELQNGVKDCLEGIGINVLIAK
jgi:hypothetical protein